MHKKTDIHDLDIPIDDIECWDKYPKHRWVYDMSRLLDAQNIKWSPFKTDALGDQVVNMYLHSEKAVVYMPAWIYINNPVGKQILSEVYIVKGEIRHIRYVDNTSKQIILDNVGDIELRISAFVSMHFQKFTGVITTETVGTDIYAIRLRPIPELALVANTEVSKLIKRIYKKNDVVHINGLTDQQLHEVLVS
jgi:hypothetical protein